ncbi:MAG: pimeloyl-ACP methyl ester carboxylesterase [Planctomycetota bacterium]
MITLPILFVALCSQGEVETKAERWNSLTIEGGGSIEYVVVKPLEFDPSVAHPVLIALPPGPQTKGMVERGLELYFEEEAIARGWVVISPAAPEGKFFHKGAQTEFNALMDLVESTFIIQGDVVHLAGVSNGGRSAFHLAGSAPQRFASLSALPGVAGSHEDVERLSDLARMPIGIWAGELDTDWAAEIRNTITRLSELGAPELLLKFVEGESHVLDGKLRHELFDRLDYLQARQLQRIDMTTSIETVLDSLHDAADKADEERYFSLFAPGAIFIGTDATERWTVAEFREYAKAPFERESAWTYKAIERHIELSSDGQTAWFDERLINAKYGETRGSGVLVYAGGEWRIAHYVLSFAVPNDSAGEVVEVIKTAKD